jgi:hypothetical protein
VRFNEEKPARAGFFHVQTCIGGDYLESGMTTTVLPPDLPRSPWTPSAPVDPVAPV